MITFSCPHCHGSMESPDSQAGQLENCPACSQVVEVPFSRPPAPRVVVASGDTRPTKRPSSAQRHKTLIGWVVALLAVAAAPVAAWLGGCRYETIAGIAMVMVVAFGVLAVGAIPGVIARQRNAKDARAISVLGFLGVLVFGIFWVVALIWALVAQPAVDQASAGRHACRQCAESVADGAAVCRFCGAQRP